MVDQQRQPVRDLQGIAQFFVDVDPTERQVGPRSGLVQAFHRGQFGGLIVGDGVGDPVMFFFSDRVGCLGSLLISVAATAILVMLLNR
ncbi:hypothetical protein ACIRG4_04000 [Streptomyces sp. NPDC102395]|uniref:hypothetical protein n=1 Tax=Streptomyces sp. NPDC102395 TaxID=3366168 RepID=UPI00381073A2